jgi:probable rRNA maturation factor
MSELVLRNRQRVRGVNTPLLRRIARSLLEDFCAVENYELCIHLVGAAEMACINKQFLQHEGSTDVITFDNSELGTRNSELLSGEIFLCLDDAIKQARAFGTTWQAEVVRYVIHGVLHLLGHDDLKPAARKKMKVEENRLLRQISRRFPIAALSRSARPRVNRKS